jgi:hypothetical protein
MREPPTQAIVCEPEPERAQVEAHEDQIPRLGDWLWVPCDSRDPRESDQESWWLGCVMHVGSNYVQLQEPPRGKYGSHRTARVHLDELSTCRPVHDPDAVIAERIAEAQQTLAGLMAEVQRVVGQLGVTTAGNLPAHAETTALARLGEAQDVGQYKEALVLAQKETLPKLFEQIEGASKDLANWMSAKTLPLQAQTSRLKTSIGAIEDRIFSVELYAGLIEQVTRICAGEAAPMGEPIHLFQRRHYMDEECLARYQAGGMRFKNIEAFDAWLAQPDNRDRILPFPRCIVAFQVRRFEFDNEHLTEQPRTLRDFIRIDAERAQDKHTFLYIRNGEQMFCLETGIEFDEQLFPDMRAPTTVETDRMWAEIDYSKVKCLVSDREYREMRRQDAADLRDWRRSRRENKTSVDSCFRPRLRTRDFKPFDQSCVYYDDIAASLSAEQRRHNRLVLVLQGLLDRSEVLAPHPPWQLASADGFATALRLVYDDSLALVSGPEPDFEAFRAKLNASLAVGSVTVGQHEAWLLREGERECARRDNDWRDRGQYRPKFYAPSGDPGPGVVAKVQAMRGSQCVFRWTRDRRRWSRYDSGEVPAAITVPKAKLLNVSAYQPGDYRRFYDDPRTRARYQEWAPLLLPAEDYHVRVGDDETNQEK